MRLILEHNQQVLVPHLEVAQTFLARSKGLLGRRELPMDQALWILRCNSVHTFFMKFSIDLVFLNRHKQVTRMIPHVAPGRLIWPVWSASSVVELREGFLTEHPLRVGDRLHVDTALS